MIRRTPAEWIHLLRAVAGVPAGSETPGELREAGRPWFGAAAAEGAGLDPRSASGVGPADERTSPPGEGRRRRGAGAGGLEARLWSAVHSADLAALHGFAPTSPTSPTSPRTPNQRAAEGAPLAASLGTEGPLLEQDAYRTIEVWTESELCALHALRNLAGRRDLDAPSAAALAARLASAIHWHLVHTQPDNATNRPWAIHAFAERDDPDAQLYAEGLLHACQISAFSAGRSAPNGPASAVIAPLSRAILVDAAASLERRVLTGRAGPP
ncbi:MAG TPA: hypothetical protein PKC43_13740 [Phycisphaerales bacterium]|nr:hypothetical protein [Phycisphaerales bacterium]HMP38495.1 hypothetical protein [Phycisphaerales bacterium]